MQSITRILKELTPPVCYRFIENLYRLCTRHSIDSSHKFQGKVFCIGFNKTGTTSVEQVLKDFGYPLGNQPAAEMLLHDCNKQDCGRLIRYCQTAEAFQDIPFSLPQTYRHLDNAFPKAKFILTIRDSKEQWYQSLLRFHAKLFSSDKNRPPSVTDLENALYRYKGFGLDVMKMVFSYPEVELYDCDYYTKVYEDHNKSVIEYFNDRPGKLLVLNISQPNAYQELAYFLNVRVSDRSRFPWENKT